MTDKSDLKDPPKGIDMKKVKKVVMAAFLLFGVFSLLPTAVQATHYNFTDLTTSEGYFRPTSWFEVPSTQTLGFFRVEVLIDDHYNRTNITDDIRVHFSTAQIQRYASLWANFTITEDESLVDNITISAEGYGIIGPHNYTEIWIWNGAAWTQLLKSVGPGAADNSTTYEITSGFEDYIQTNQIYMLFTSETGNSDLKTFDLYVDFINIEVTEGTSAASAAFEVNDSYPQLGEAVLISATLTNATPVSTIYLQTNESGSWETFDGLYDSPRIAEPTNGNVTNFTWVNGSYCNRLLGFRAHYNDSSDVWYYGSVNTTTLLPFISSSTAFRANVSSSSCDNSSHIDYRFNFEQQGYMELQLDHVKVGGNYTCPYGMTGVANFSTTNATNYCTVKGLLSGVVRYQEYYVSRSAAVSFVEPPNIPKAITVSTILFIFVVVTIQVTRKSGGW